jgi:hypothetical protein
MQKHESVRRVVFQLWTDFILVVPSGFLDNLAKLVLDRYKGESDVFAKEEWEMELYLLFVEKLFTFGS